MNLSTIASRMPRLPMGCLSPNRRAIVRHLHVNSNETQGKRSFRYGRIDVRAVAPGAGHMASHWMLGENITSVDGHPVVRLTLG